MLSWVSDLVDLGAMSYAVTTMATGPVKDMTIRNVSAATRRRLKMVTAHADVPMAEALALLTRLYEVMEHEVRVDGPEAASARRWLEAVGFTFPEE